MIDTAQAYLNEEAVGNAWKKNGIMTLIGTSWFRQQGTRCSLSGVGDVQGGRSQGTFSLLPG
mgnify:FL=1